MSLQNLKVPHGSSWVLISGNGCAAARNEIVSQMNGEWLWFMDDDHSFPHDILLRLLDRKVDILQPLVATRKPPFKPYAYMLQPDSENLYDGIPWSSIKPAGLNKVDGCGTGGCLIRKAVFDAVERPWFEEGHPQKDFLYEDLNLMTKARGQGFQPWVDSDVRMGHLNPHEVWPAQTPEGEWCIALDLGHGVRLQCSIEVGKAQEVA